MPGSASSLSCANTVLNTAVAEELKQFADELEGKENFEEALHELIKRTIKEHKRIIFNGDGYDDSWVKEAESRGLLNLKTTPDALGHFLDPKNVKLYESHGVYNERELKARYEVLMENYTKVLNIEALTMLDMANKDILPAMSKFTTALAEACTEKTIVSANIDRVYEKETLRKITAMMTAMYKQAKKLESDLFDAKSITDITELGNFYKDTILQDMKELRIPADEMEMISSAEYWPYPSYGQMLFSVR